MILSKLVNWQYFITHKSFSPNKTIKRIVNGKYVIYIDGANTGVLHTPKGDDDYKGVFRSRHKPVLRLHGIYNDC